MHACSGSMMGAVHQSVWTTGPTLHPKVSTGVEFPYQIRLHSPGSCKASYVEGSLVTGRPTAPAIDGKPLYLNLSGKQPLCARLGLDPIHSSQHLIIMGPALALGNYLSFIYIYLSLYYVLNGVFSW